MTSLPPKRFELLLPRVWNRSHKPVFIHLAGTGDHVRHVTWAVWLHCVRHVTWGGGGGEVYIVFVM